MTRLSIRWPGRVIAAWVVLVIAGGLIGANGEDRFVNEDFAVPDRAADRALESERRRFGAAEDLTLVLLGSDAELRRAVPQVARTLSQIRGVQFASLPKAPGPDSSPHMPGSAIFPLKASSDYKAVGDDVAPDVLRRVRDVAPPGITVHLTGLPVLSHQIREADFSAAERAQSVALPVLLLVLLLTFRAPIAAAVPLALGIAVITVGTGALVAVTTLTDVEAVARVLMSMIGLALGVDYSLLLVARFREELRAGRDTPEAVERAMATAGRTITQAGLVVATGMAVAFVLGLSSGLRSGSAAVIGAAVLSVAAGRTLLPALLMLIGRRIDAWKLERRASRPWSAPVVEVALRRPWLTLAAAGLPAVAIAVSAFGLQTGPSDIRVLPDGDSGRRAFGAVAERVGPGWNAPFTLVAESPSAPTTERVVRSLERQAARTPGVAAVVGGRSGSRELFRSPDGAAARLLVVPAPPADVLAVRDLRKRLVRLARTSVRDPEVRAELSSRLAAMQEFNELTAGRRGSSIVILALLSIPVLFLVLRSIVVPLKAAILNVLTVGVAFGALRLLFSGDDALLGGPGWIDLFAFFGIFAVIYTLSMDYELFLVGRVQEHYRRHGDSDAAVRAGVVGTAAVVTSAAAIMVSVFVTFALFGSGIVQQFGAGLAVAIVFDATVVRLLLLPAAMRLLGAANWWLPAAIDRRLPHPETG